MEIPPLKIVYLMCTILRMLWRWYIIMECLGYIGSIVSKAYLVSFLEWYIPEGIHPYENLAKNVLLKIALSSIESQFDNEKIEKDRKIAEVPYTPNISFKKRLNILYLSIWT